jgi:hypothetical protein
MPWLSSVEGRAGAEALPAEVVLQWQQQVLFVFHDQYEGLHDQDISPRRPLSSTESLTWGLHLPLATRAESAPEIPICSAINAQHRLASEISAEAHHGTLEQKAA